MKLNSALLLAFFLLSIKLTAQESVNLSLYGNVTVPIADFKEAIDNSVGGAGVGVGTNFLFNPKGKKAYSPIFLGIDFSYVTFGRDKQEATTNGLPYKTTFNYYNISGVSRIFLTDKTEGLTPFIDGMLGLKIFNTRTKIDKDLIGTIINDQPEVIHTTNDTGLGYGLGVGFYKRHPHTEEGSGGASVSMRVMYLWGDKTSYVKRGSLQVDNGAVTYETGYANTNMILIQLGITIHD